MAVGDHIILPDWIYEGAEVYVHMTRGKSWHTPDPEPATVARFTNQRIIVDTHRDRGWAFAKDTLRGIGPAGNYDLIHPNSNAVTVMLRTSAVKEAMGPLRTVFHDMSLRGRMGWDELPDALETAEAFHEASLEAIERLAEARERYGEGSRRVQR